MAEDELLLEKDVMQPFPPASQVSATSNQESHVPEAPPPRWLVVAVGALVLVLVGAIAMIGVSVFGEPESPRTMAELKIQQAELAVRKRPSDYAAHLDLGAAYLEVGKDQQALSEFQTVVKLAPDNYLGYYALANAYVVSDQPERAIKMFVEAIDRVPGNGALYFGLGDLYLQEGRPKDAIVVLEVAVKIEPIASDTRMLLGRAYEETGRVEDAIAQYEEAARYGAAEAQASLNRLRSQETSNGAAQ